MNGSMTTHSSLIIPLKKKLHFIAMVENVIWKQNKKKQQYFKINMKHTQDPV